MNPKEEHVIPEHLINVPLRPSQELKIVARVNALKLFILESLPDSKARSTVRNRLEELEEQCLKTLKKKIAEQINEKDFESRFSTQTTKTEDGKPSTLGL